MGAVRLPMVLRNTNYDPRLGQINGQLAYTPAGQSREVVILMQADVERRYLDMLQKADAGEAGVSAMDASVDDSGAPAPVSSTQRGIREGTVLSLLITAGLHIRPSF